MLVSYCLENTKQQKKSVEMIIIVCHSGDFFNL